MSIVIPDACTLPTADQPRRLAEFDALFATAVRRVDPIGPTRARLWLTGPPGLAATVSDLTARETECCSFFTFTVTPEPAADGEALILDVEVPAGSAEVLDALVREARTMRLGTIQDSLAEQQQRAARHGVWQQVFTRVEGRDHLSDTATGLALRFPLDGELAATLARLAAAEYRCCSFGSYTIVIDRAGLRLEVRMPDDAAGMLAAVFGVPDLAAEVSR